MAGKKKSPESEVTPTKETTIVTNDAPNLTQSSYSFFQNGGQWKVTRTKIDPTTLSSGPTELVGSFLSKNEAASTFKILVARELIQGVTNE
jgi:hypothetical protein